jgi:tetratricopeptide (TPR) repeat protein
MDYTRICFVIMPFGKKDVLDENGKTRIVDFDLIYEAIFDPAIRQTVLPEGGRLEARRTDQDFFSGDISQDMFEYLEYSRFAIADITGLNPNVFYELGVRHRARQAGTAIFRQLAAKIPFDITQIKAFPYDYEPEDHARESKNLVTRVLTESLLQNRIDSPVQRALIVQRNQHGEIEGYLRNAENAIRAGDRARAIAEYRKALADDPGNNLLHLRLGLLLKDEGRWDEALQQFDAAIASAPNYAEAYREKGIAENKLHHLRGRIPECPNGIVSLKRAAELNDTDYDAHASLAGALKREGELEAALAEYERAIEVSHGHSYPLLNAIKLRARIENKLEIDARRRFQLNRAERSLRAQVSSDPPYDAPWSFFDLAEILLYKQDMQNFILFASRGTEFATHAWQVNTFREGLELLLSGGIELPGLREGIEMLRERGRYLT